MKIGFTSTAALSNAPRLHTIKLQGDLYKAQQEMQRLRYADIGLAIGFDTGQAVTLRAERTRIDEIKSGNALAATRLDLTQTALSSMSKTASDMIGQLFGARNSTTGPAAIKESGQAALKSLSDLLNSQLNGTFLFAGINTDVKPVADYFSTPTSAPRQAVENAFTAYFGFAQSDPQAANITATQMQAFLDGDFANLFTPANWSTTWSSASDQNIKSRISNNELIDTSANANDASFRRLASAYTMLSDLNVQGLSQTAFQAVVDTATKMIGGAVKDITELQASLGVSQSRITEANDRMSIQADLIDKHIQTLEGVDPYEATTRVNALMTQIETAYAMTSRIQQLSILKYL